MNIEMLILAASVHALIWEHLPHWGTWFMRMIEALPRPLQTLYGQWHCPYCAGFWIALVLHGITGIWTFEAFAGFSVAWGGLAAPLAWVFDALATALLVKTTMLTLNALSGPALAGYRAKAEFMAARDAE
ncbi:hypothetical protein [Hasllibacter sp. MH4015]|uniref:hypothetical protein n=1 Tax=Hasllibacter sp. MH4015 TaxID=2854029 RepID=UPI001CD580F7|nr:hypothetical protein [Hasllibacter sp. MH4015]